MDKQGLEFGLSGRSLAGDDAIRELRVADERGAEHRTAAVVIVEAGLARFID